MLLMDVFISFELSSLVSRVEIVLPRQTAVMRDAYLKIFLCVYSVQIKNSGTYVVLTVFVYVEKTVVLLPVRIFPIYSRYGDLANIYIGLYIHTSLCSASFSLPLYTEMCKQKPFRTTSRERWGKRGTAVVGSRITTGSLSRVVYYNTVHK